MDNYFSFDEPFVLHILIYYDTSDKVWSAHCLDFSLVEDGNNPEEAEMRLAKTVKSYLKAVRDKKMKKEEIYSPAPQFFWDLIMSSNKIKVRRQPKKFPIPYLAFKSKPINASASL